MPTISLTQIAMFATKAVIFSVFVALVYTFMDTFVIYISIPFNHIFSKFASFEAISLGYVASVTGLTAFLNNLISLLFVAAKLYVSIMVSIIIFHYSIKLYQSLFKF